MREPFAGGSTPPVQPPEPLPPEPDFADPTDGPRVVPESESGFYRVLTPVEDYQGLRYGKLFVEGEAVVHTKETTVRTLPGKGPVQYRLVDELVQDFGYHAEPIPVGVPPIPRSQLRAAGIPYAVANS